MLDAGTLASSLLRPHSNAAGEYGFAAKHLTQALAVHATFPLGNVVGAEDPGEDK
jgi:hypothetical protein